MKNYIVATLLVAFLGVGSLFAFSGSKCCSTKACKTECVKAKCCSDQKTCDTNGHKDCKHKCCDKSKSCDSKSAKADSCSTHKKNSTSNTQKKCCSTKK